MSHRFESLDDICSRWGGSSGCDEFLLNWQRVENSAPVSCEDVGDGFPIIRFRTMQKSRRNPFAFMPTQWGFDRWDAHVKTYRETSGQPLAFPFRQRIFGWSFPYTYKVALVVYMILPVYLAHVVGFLTSSLIPSMLGHGHGSLTWYIYTCWAKEKSAILRPDTLWYTVASEVAREVRLTPDKYRHLFTSSKDRETLVTRTDKYDDISIHAVDATLDRAVADKELKDIVVETRFSHETEGYEEVIKSVFSNMSSPFFNHMSCLCGIPEVGVQGTYDDWTALVTSCSRLAEKFPGRLKDYLKHAANLFLTIRDNAFCAFDTDEERYRSELFFSAMFWCTAVCGSGTSYEVRGWITELCQRTTQAEACYRPSCDCDSWDPQSRLAIDSFPAHLSSFAWENAETSKKYCKISGLFYSSPGKYNFLIPYYGQSTFEVTDEAAFARLKA